MCHEAKAKMGFLSAGYSVSKDTLKKIYIYIWSPGMAGIEAWTWQHKWVNKHTQAAHFHLGRRQCFKVQLTGLRDNTKDCRGICAGWKMHFEMERNWYGSNYIHNNSCTCAFNFRTKGEKKPIWCFCKCLNCASVLIKSDFLCFGLGIWKVGITEEKQKSRG